MIIIKCLILVDTEKNKEMSYLNSGEKNYLNECEKQMQRTQDLSLHFMDKGTKLTGLEKITCSYDGRFAPRQCKPGYLSNLF